MNASVQRSGAAPASRRDMAMHSVLPGDHLVVDAAEEAVTTLLGSCVAACIRDRRSGLGGLNHFLLPGDETRSTARYGSYAMEVLINEILTRGGLRHDLEAKVFGGASVIASSIGYDIGKRNAEFVLDYLSTEGIRILAQDLGGTRGRRLVYHPATGDARVQYLDATQIRDTVASEARLDATLNKKPVTGTVELFG